MNRLLTIVVPGTGWEKWSSTYDLDARPMQNIARTFGTTPVLFAHWKGKNSRAARLRAASDLAAFIQRELQANRQRPGDRLNIVGFSHGGNVAALATRLLAAQVDNLVTIATPVVSGYLPGAVGNHIHIYNPHDTTQVWGGESFTFPGLGTIGPAGRVFPHAANSEVSIVYGNRHQRHGNLLWDDRTWSQIKAHLR
jgi:pimeloyl-ACP methyl ester carboxylesterase